MTTPELLDRLRNAADAMADAVYDEGLERLAVGEYEAEIATSLMGQLNPATNKPHSASSAKDSAKDMPEVRQRKAQLLDAERRTIMARAGYECARIAAWASVAPAGGL